MNRLRRRSALSNSESPCGAECEADIRQSSSRRARRVALRMTACAWLLTLPAVAAGGSGATTAREAERADAHEPIQLSRPERHVILMPVVGIWDFPFEQSGWTAKPGPVWGLNVKVEPFRWLGVRANFLRGNQQVQMDAGALRPGYSTYQPTLAMTRLELRAEPTLVLTRSLCTYLGLGLSWGRFVAPEAESSPRLHTLDRSGVHVGYEGAVGVAYEPFADLIVLDFSIAGSLLDDQTGSAYESVQAFTADGHRTSIGGLSRFSGAARAMFGIGVVL